MRMVQEGFYPPSAHAAHGAGMRQPGMANNGYNYGMDQNGFDWPVHNASNAHQPRAYLSYSSCAFAEFPFDQVNHTRLLP